MINSLIDELKNKKDDLEKSSVFLIRKEDYKDEKGINTDFEFFVFVDNPPKVGEQDNRPGFLKELHRYLCEDADSFAVAEHEEELAKWLDVDMKNSDRNELITPLNWLKIAIERFPYRLFVIIDKDSWGDGSCNPLKVKFWFNDNPLQGNPAEWYKSNFLYKRICWIDKASFNDSLKPERIKEYLLCEWIKHIRSSLLATNNINDIGLFISTDDADATNMKTLPSDCFKSESSNTHNVNCGIKLADIQDSVIIFQKHGKEGTVNKLVGLNKKYNTMFYFEILSGSQYQLPLLGEKGKNIYPGVMECTLSMAIFDERYAQWWAQITPERKKEILTTRIYPIRGFKHTREGPFSIAKEGCILNETFAIEGDELNKCHSGLNKAGERVNLGSLADLIGLKDGDGCICPNILVIHQGIIDRLKNEGIPFDIMQAKEKIPYIIVTSGRGYPHNLPKGVKFLPFSSMEFYMMKNYPEKFLFLKIAMKL